MTINSSKGRTLEELTPRLSKFKIPKLLIFTVQSFVINQEAIIRKIQEEFPEKIIILRSSASDEDGSLISHAGAFDSVLNVDSSNFFTIESGIMSVISSYKLKNSSDNNNEIIAQEMLTNSSMSGVVFTHDLNTGAPYYVINYDDQSSLTNTVTSGGGEYANRTVYIHRNSADALRSERFRRLIQAVQEVETVLDNEFLDIEFALGHDHTPYLLQVRSITTRSKWSPEICEMVNSELPRLQDEVARRLLPQIGSLGRTTVLGQMPDWNPAELIGRAPRALAFSLYSRLITDGAWKNAREVMGYNVPDDSKLMLSLAGQPFIDTRLSFNSFLPKNLPKEIGEKLVNAWVERLRNNPQLHDRVEFDVAITTFSFDIESKFENLIDSVLTDDELHIYRSALRDQTYCLIQDQGDGSIAKALQILERLSLIPKENAKSKTSSFSVKLENSLKECIEFGTVPFAILARHGFIALTLLNSLVARRILSKNEMDLFLASIRTIASSLVDDMMNLQAGKISNSKFMSLYGHLRPGTYDIMSPRYDQISDFGSNKMEITQVQRKSQFGFSKSQKDEIQSLLNEEGFTNLNANDLLIYFEKAIVGREFGKFVFTRSLSSILETIAEFGSSVNLSREEMSHISITDLIRIVGEDDLNSTSKQLKAVSNQGAERHQLSNAIRLPQVIFDTAGIYVVPFQISHPNFITQKKITANAAILAVNEFAYDLNGKIILIENADPGYDWIFSYNIAGLVTKYGGANSHMAIRCAEFEIPAAIGCGEQRFEAILGASQISIDCAAGLISSVH